MSMLINYVHKEVSSMHVCVIGEGNINIIAKEGRKWEIPSIHYFTALDYFTISFYLFHWEFGMELF